jgi:dihydrofolate reductase
MSPRLALIVAAGADGVIGDGRVMPWHLPRDLRRFRDLTLGHPIIMGRRTHESIGRALPGRTNIVLTRQAAASFPGCVVVSTPEAALAAAAAESANTAFVIGGAQIYNLFLDKADLVYLTRVHGQFPGEVRFPVESLVEPCWRITSREDFPADSQNPFATTFLRYERNPGE